MKHMTAGVRRGEIGRALILGFRILEKSDPSIAQTFPESPFVEISNTYTYAPPFRRPTFFNNSSSAKIGRKRIR